MSRRTKSGTPNFLRAVRFRFPVYFFQGRISILTNEYTYIYIYICIVIVISLRASMASSWRTHSTPATTWQEGSLRPGSTAWAVWFGVYLATANIHSFTDKTNIDNNDHNIIHNNNDKNHNNDKNINNVRNKITTIIITILTMLTIIIRSVIIMQMTIWIIAEL